MWPLPPPPPPPFGVRPTYILLCVQVTKRAVCTPDFEQLYRRADEISAGGQEGFAGGLPVAGFGVDAGGEAGPVKMEED